MMPMRAGLRALSLLAVLLLVVVGPAVGLTVEGNPSDGMLILRLTDAERGLLIRWIQSGGRPGEFTQHIQNFLDRLRHRFREDAEQRLCREWSNLTAEQQGHLRDALKLPATPCP